jgi:glycosyltransferase involved in cell wall biosynthesis
MRILFSVHLYPPKHNCGGEYYIHNMAKWLISKGNQVRVCLHQGADYGIFEPYTYEGVEVFPVTGPQSVQIHLMTWCEIVFTHLGYTNWTIQVGRMLKKKIFFVVHNDTPYPSVTAALCTVNIIYNSQWIADKLQYKHPSIVMTPPVDMAYYDQGKDPFANEFITLINCNDNKGGKQFIEIAKRMPERRFLAVRGSYEEQFIDESLPNMSVHPNTPDILPIYRMTRILLMPSEYESWGMTASEAMCNGIPVICTQTPGLLENTAGKMLYCERDDVDGWVKKIKSLDNRSYYSRISNAGRARAKELNPESGYQKLEAFIYAAMEQ